MGTLRHLRRTLSPRISSLEAVRQNFEEGAFIKNRMGEVKWGRCTQKMSEVILDFAEPLLRDAPDLESEKTAIAFAIICWNIAILKETGDEKVVEETLGAAGDEAGKELRRFAKEMMERKQSFFADNKKLILDYQFTEEPEGFHLYVVSTAAK